MVAEGIAVSQLDVDTARQLAALLQECRRLVIAANWARGEALPSPRARAHQEATTAVQAGLLTRALTPIWRACPEIDPDPLENSVQPYGWPQPEPVAPRRLHDDLCQAIEEAGVGTLGGRIAPVLENLYDACLTLLDHARWLIQTRVDASAAARFEAAVAPERDLVERGFLEPLRRAHPELALRPSRRARRG